MRLVLGTGIGVWNAGLRSWELGCEFRSGVLGGGVKAANAVMGDEVRASAYGFPIDSPCGVSRVSAASGDLFEWQSTFM